MFHNEQPFRVIHLSAPLSKQASSCSRHQSCSLHNTSLFAVAVRPTLIIYLLQFRLFFEYFSHFLSTPPLATLSNGRRKKRDVRVCEALNVVVAIIIGRGMEFRLFDCVERFYTDTINATFHEVR